MTSAGGARFRGRELELELFDPNSEQLVRLFRHPGGEWEAPPEKYRNQRVDPPHGHKADYAMLYTAGTLPAVAVECRVLRVDSQDRYAWSRTLASQYQVARYNFAAPALFVPIDGANRGVLGLQGGTRKFAGYEPYQKVALTLFQRYGQVIHGLSWESFHRNQPGRVFALSGSSRPREWCTRGSSDPSFFSSEPVGDTRPKAAELQRAIIVVSG